ncbi:MAG: DNA primase [Myxococcota bacterium]
MKTATVADNRHIIEQIKQRVDLLQIVSQSVRLRKQGRRWVGLCPFHNEKTPSFYVDPQEGYFKCFGCDEGGDVFSFLQKHTGQSFTEILQQLAQQTGVNLPQSGASATKSSIQLQRTLRFAEDFFVRCLQAPTAQAKAAMRYLTAERGLGAQQIARYGFGLCPAGASELLAWLQQHDISAASAAQAGLVQTAGGGQRSFFANRIIIPLHNARGVIVGFGARVWQGSSQQPKYLNSPANSLYNKSAFLYGLSHALPLLRQGQSAVLVEGYFDVVALQSLNQAAVAACGTSMTTKHVELLRRYSNDVVLCLDGDTAGQAASNKALLLLLQHGFRVRNACLQQSDPAQLYCLGKSKQLQQQVQQAPDALELLIRHTAEQIVVNPSQRLKQLDELLPFLAAPARMLHVQQYTRIAAQLLGEHEATLQQEIAAHRSNSQLRKAPAPVVKPTAVTGWRDIDNLLLQLLLRHPQLALECPSAILQQSHELLQGFIGDLTRALKQQQGQDPQAALRQVHLSASSPMVPLLICAQQEGICANLQEAQEILQQWQANITQKKGGNTPAKAK